MLPKCMKELSIKRNRWILMGALFIGVMLPMSTVDAADIKAGVINTMKGATNSQFVLHVDGVTAAGGVSKIDCDVWSANNSQDDIKNYVLDGSGSGPYTQVVNLSDHYNDDGFYYVDVYATDGGGRVKIGDTYALIKKSEITWDEWTVNGTKIETTSYAAKLTASGKMTPNVQANNTDTNLKSGYGYYLDVDSSTTASDSLTGDGTVTAPQNINTVFPEFNYKDGVTIKDVKSSFNRLGIVGSYSAEANVVKSTMNFKKNPFSTNESQVHFTPFLYPDETGYKISVDVFDAWTPAGMLASTVTPGTSIDSQVYDDWHIAPIN